MVEVRIEVTEMWPVYVLNNASKDDSYGEVYMIDERLLIAHQEASKVYWDLQLQLAKIVGPL